MVVLSAAVCTKSGKTLLSRQFVVVGRLRIEGLLTAFPKLLGSDAKQHTFIETESVRYVYQPMEELFLLIITNRSSNIVEDLETIRLLSKLVPDICGGVSEENIQQHAFELLFAFDEAISQGGMRENLSLSQIKTNLEMDSHEEKLQNMIQASRVEAARDQADKMARTISDRKREESRLGQSLGNMVGIEGGSSDPYGHESEISPYGRSTSGGMEGMGSSGFGSSNSSNSEGYIQPSTQTASSSRQTSQSTARKPKASSGMKLGSSSSSSMKLGGGKGSLLNSLAQEEKISPISLTQQQQQQQQQQPPQSVESSSQQEQHQETLFESNHVQLVETVSCTFTRDGEATSFDLKGDLTITICAEDASLAPHIELEVDEEVVSEQEVAFQCNPKMNKNDWEASRTLVLKNTKKGSLPNKPLKALRWRSSNLDLLASLFTFSCWVEEDSEENGAFLLNIDWSLEEGAASLGALQFLSISLPTPPNMHHDVVASERGEVLQNVPLPRPTEHTSTGVTWRCVNVQPGDAETLELRVRNGGFGEDALFPLQVTFSSTEGLITPLQVTGCTSHADGAPLDVVTDVHMSSEVVTII